MGPTEPDPSEQISRGISPSTADVAAVKDGLQALRAMQGTTPPPPTPDLQLATQQQPAVKPRKRAPDPSRIPDRAFAGADYLRSRLVTEDPASWIARQKWDATKKEGVRLKWADTIRLINEADKHDYDEIAKVVSWLFNQPLGGPRFVVQSPESLREKWDQIQAVRRNKGAPQRGRQLDNRPPPEFKRWDANDWDKGDKT